MYPHNERSNGGTDWRRFAAWFIPSLLLVLLLATLITMGVLPTLDGTL